MRRIITAILAVTLALTMALPTAADQNSDTSRKIYEEHTVVWSEAEGGKITLITTTEYDELATADQLSPAFRFEIAATSSATQLLSDETEKGKEALALAISGKRIPAGTVIQVEYGGGIDGSYPAQIGTPAKVIFCGTRTSILLSQVMPIIDMLNSIGESEKYSISADESANFRVLTDLDDVNGAMEYFTVMDSAYNERYETYDITMTRREKHFSVAENKELWYYTTTNISLGKNSGITVSHDGSKRGTEQFDKLFNSASSINVNSDEYYKLFNHGSNLIDVGTVLGVYWDGRILECYPPVLTGITEVTVTGLKTDIPLEDLELELQHLNDVFENEPLPAEADPITIGEPVNIPEGNLFQSSPYDNADKNPATGMDTVFAGTALIGVLAWVASLISLKRQKGTENK